jgi:tetratricopeptide (TPR) repeat protein
MARSQFSYKAFISYSHADERWAKTIHRFLESYRIPKRLVGTESQSGSVPRRLRPIFRDRDELASAADLSTVVNEALAASEHLIVVCSPSSAASRWVNEEVLEFKRMGRADRILCLLVDGEPNASDVPGQAHAECFCEALRFRLGDDGRLSDERAEPIAADARKRRRYRRMAYVASAALAGMAFTLLLAVTAYTARNEAERRREQADNLIGFMLGDLRERLNEVGRLDVLDSVSEQAMAYFAELPPGDLDDGALARRAEALMQLGQVSLARGDLRAAGESFGEALRTMLELNTRDPSDLDRLFGLGQAHFWVGYVQWENNDLTSADVNMRAYHEISDRLYRVEPLNDDYILELGYAFNNLAILSDSRGDTQGALDYNERMIALGREVHERDEGNETYRRALAEAYSWRGSMLRNDGRLAESRSFYSEYFELVREAVTVDPDDTQWLDLFVVASRFLGDSMLDLGQLEEAGDRYREGLATATRLTAIEPDNKRWQIERALLLRRMAEMMLRGDETDEAFRVLDLLRTQVDAELADDRNDLDWRFIEAELGFVTARVWRSRRQADRSMAIAAEVSENARGLLAASPGDRAGRLLLANCLLFEGKPEEALAVLEHDSMDHADPGVQSTRLLALLRSEGATNVRAGLAELEAAGYRHPDYLAGLAELGIAAGVGR